MKDPTRVGKPGVNYYALLGVPSTATQEEITKAFRKRILVVHLDKQGPADDSETCYLTIEAHRILSDKGLRQKYDVERSSSKEYKASDEKFTPAGYICYDVGHQQMSRQLLDSISNWTTEYEKCGSELSDNYFNCFSTIMTHVMSSNEDPVKNKEGIMEGNETSYYCPVCDKKYVSEAHHWDSTINPYRAMFFSDLEGIGALTGYFQGIIGEKIFDWEVRYLPTRLLGIWGSSEWSLIPKLNQQTANILKQTDFYKESDEGKKCAKVISQLEGMMNAGSKNASFTSAQNAFVRRSLIQNLIWVMENREQTVEQMMSRMNELIMQDDIQEIMSLGGAMRAVLKFESAEWGQLVQEALSQEHFELAMLWTKIAIESGDKKKGDWFQLGVTIRGLGDAVLAHFCFLMAGCDDPDDWEGLAELFTQNGAHYAAIEYHLNRGNLIELLEKSRQLKETDPESAAIYSGVFYATRIKGLLQTLRKRPRTSSTDPNENFNEELEELIELIQELGGNPLEGFRIVVTTWPDVFEEGPGFWIHRATINYLRKGKVNLKSQKLILAGVHFLPEDEAFEEICEATKDASQLTRKMLEKAQDTNDFEMLTDVLLHLNKRTLSAAEGYLEEVRPKPPPPPEEESVDEEEDDETEMEDDEEDDEEEEAEENDEENGENTDKCENDEKSKVKVENKEEFEKCKKKSEENVENPDKADEKQEEPQQLPPEPPHKAAMILLLSGTILKVKENWLGAMKDYQTALLSAPEVMHRVLPCVSKLTQDIQFHEAVVAQVHREILDLQSSWETKQYPNVDEFSSDKRPSLILTDIAPKMDYGYKDSVNRIQPDPDKMPPPPPPDEEPMDAPPPPPANTPMVTLDRNQDAIQTGQQDGQMDQLSAALAYVDLLKALPVTMHAGPIVMAASHFLRAMDESNPDEIGKLYAYRNAIMLQAENLLRVDKKLQHTIHHGLTHKHMLSILLSAHEKLSKALARKNDRNNNQDESPPDIPKDSCQKDLIRKSEAQIISRFFQNVVNFPKVEPLASIPTLNCSDLVYVETLGNSFLSRFCSDKVRQKHQSPLIPKHLHAYTHFVEVWKGRSTLSDFPQARVKAMEELLALKGWSMADVQYQMMWPIIPIQTDGFSPQTECLLQLRDPFRSYRTIDGFHINYETGTVELLMSRDTLYPVDTLFDWFDILDVVSLSKNGLEKLVFSLETPANGGTAGFCSHPFKEAVVQAGTKGVSDLPEFVMATLTRVSMLVCYLASGLEMCSEAPFWMKRTDEGLLARLDEHLQYLARPVSWRKAERAKNEKNPVETETVGKFWLNMVEVFEEIEEDDEESHYDVDPSSLVVHNRQLTYRVGQMRTELKPNTVVMMVDKGKQKLNEEGEFCKDFSQHFSEFSRAFPELQRLEELVKLSIVCGKLRQVLKENKALIQEFQGRNHPSKSGENSNVKAVERVCGVIEAFLTLQRGKRKEEKCGRNTCCNWFPATFCHNMDPDVYDVTAGIDLDPVVTYGPVPPQPKPIKVPLERIIEFGGGSVVQFKEKIVIQEKPFVEEERELENEDEESATNRTLCAVPEESEDEEDGEQCDIVTDTGEESEESVTDRDAEESSECAQESLKEEDILTDDEDDNEEVKSSEREEANGESSSEEEEEEGSKCSSVTKQSDDEENRILEVKEDEEGDVPTLTIVFKRNSIISQKSESDDEEESQNLENGEGSNDEEDNEQDVKSSGETEEEDVDENTAGNGSKCEDSDGDSEEVTDNPESCDATPSDDESFELLDYEENGKENGDTSRSDTETENTSGNVNSSADEKSPKKVNNGNSSPDKVRDAKSTKRALLTRRGKRVAEKVMVDLEKETQDKSIDDQELIFVEK